MPTPAPNMPVTGSLWHATLPAELEGPGRTSLPGDTDVDVAIVGGGYTGLWTAYSLAERDPTLRIVVLESEVVGFGASGRNGGWASALLPMSLTTMAAEHGRDAAVRMQRAMHAAIDEIVRVTSAEGIDCHLAKGGWFGAARNLAQVGRLDDELAEMRAFGFTEDDVRWLGPDEARNMLSVSACHGALFTPHCAAIHPARLARGLGLAVERRGVTIHEHTRVTSIEPRRLVTEHGTVRASYVVRATEGFTPTLPGHRRRIVPIYSLMIATEPLPQSFFDDVGWADRQTFSDARRLVIYGQRTADDRIAFGGRGAPYHFGSRVDPSFDLHTGVHEGLHHTLREIFPALGDAAITHRWGGPVGVPRDWQCSVGLDRGTGLGWAGGYVGDGVTTTNLAGRTLAALIAGDDDDPIVSLTWVGHRSRSWEPEPLRWIGINAMVRLPISADAYEERHGRPERWRSAVLSRMTGH
ncbi:MAG: FAD-dependent oxidoreductase [Ilumatobacteraceae bacterium]